MSYLCAICTALIHLLALIVASQTRAALTVFAIAFLVVVFSYVLFTDSVAASLNAYKLSYLPNSFPMQRSFLTTRLLLVAGDLHTMLSQQAQNCCIMHDGCFLFFLLFLATTLPEPHAAEVMQQVMQCLRCAFSIPVGSLRHDDSRAPARRTTMSGSSSPRPTCWCSTPACCTTCR